MSRIESSARQAANSSAMDALARLGLTVRGLIYLVIGWLAIQIALGHRTQEANQKGALAEIAHHSFGKALLWVLGFGFAAYALWRLSEAAFGTAAEGRKAGPRVKSLVRGLIYAGFAVMTFTFIAGTGKSQNQQQTEVTAKVMKHTGGRWLVGLIGVIVVLIGLGMAFEGLRRKFEKELRMEELHGITRTVVLRLGMFGTTARGVVFAVAGALVVEAAVNYDASKATGLDAALRTLANHSYGPWILGVLAVGLIAFGLYGFASARFAKT